jgi:hypothetical protein
MTPEIKLFDVVALTRDLPEKRLFKGQVGTVVECLIMGAFEVEFADTKGRSYAFASLKPEDLMVLHYKPVEVGAGAEG